MSIDLPGVEGAVARRLLERLEEAGRSGLAGPDLEAAIAGDWTPAQVAAGLRVLREEGLAAEWNRRWIAVRFTDWAWGRIQMLERGDALIRSGERGEAGYFAARRSLKGALDGDDVLARPVRRRGGGSHRLPEATVVQVVKRRRRQIVGTLEDDGSRRWLVPFDSKLALDVEVEGGDERLEDQYVVVEISDRPSDPRARAAGRVVEVLGSADVPGVDVEVVLRRYGIEEAFPPAVLAQAEEFPADPGEESCRGREDLRRVPLVTIDGETARDFDDAISVEELAGPNGGGFRLGVHIADVAAYVTDGSPLDLEAYRRGTSVYYPERAIPMLPEKLSNGLCSLKPGVPRLALSVFLDVDADGRVTGRRFAESVIRSARRLTYAEVRRLLEEPRPADGEDYGRAVLDLLRSAGKLMSVLYRRRLERGSIDFDLPEGDVILDEEGFTVGVRPGERNVAHRIIEECMIAANEAVALELTGRDSPALFRVHEAPRPGDLKELADVLKPLGLALKGDLTDLAPAALQAVLRRVEGHPEEGFVSSIVLRTLLRAVYLPECRGHYALATRHYTHFTSPIRRYPDLLVHRRIKAHLHGRAEREAEQTWLAERLPRIADHASTTERRAEASERELLRWKLVRLLAGRVGETFRGRITGVQAFGLFVMLEEYFVDGLVPIRSLADDYYVYDSESHQLTGSGNGRTFRLADEVEVELAEVDLRRRSLVLAIPGMPEPRRRERRGGEDRRSGRRRPGRAGGRSEERPSGRRSRRGGRRR